MKPSKIEFKYQPDTLISDDELEADLAKVKARIHPASPKKSNYWIAAVAVLILSVLIAVLL